MDVSKTSVSKNSLRIPPPLSLCVRVWCACAYNANIIARDLGLVDKQDHTTNGEKITGTDEELLKKIAALEKIVNDQDS